MIIYKNIKKNSPFLYNNQKLPIYLNTKIITINKKIQRNFGFFLQSKKKILCKKKPKQPCIYILKRKQFFLIN
jgi:hypothetical protein